MESKVSPAVTPAAAKTYNGPLTLPGSKGFARSIASSENTSTLGSESVNNWYANEVIRRPHFYAVNSSIKT